MSITIDGEKVEDGFKRSFFLKVAELPIGAIEIPLTVINGIDEGPTLLVTGGIHGTEYPGIKATQVLAKTIKPIELHGRMLITHCVNVPMFNARTAFVNPIDHINLNRIFPGEPEYTGFYGPGSISHHITNFVYRNLMKKSTHYIDLHGGDLPEFVPFFSISFETGEGETDGITEDMLRYTLADYIELRPKSESLTTIATASREGIPNTLIEAGGAGLLKQEDVNRHVNGVKNIMRYLDMITGQQEEPENQLKMDGTRAGIRVERGGFFTSLVEPGEVVEEGQLIGEITDPFGTVVQEIKAIISGVITIINFPAAKNVGDPVFDIAGLEER
jgi:hypothetical protein